MTRLKNILVLFLFIAWVGCNSESDSKTSATKDITVDPDYQKGLSLVAKYKCLQCHGVDNALTGPPYRQIADKYADANDQEITALGQKIISGGKGVWGEIFMTPHPDVTIEEARAMVKYILLLKK